MSSIFLRMFIVLVAFLAIDGHSFEMKNYSNRDFELARIPELRFEPLQNPTSRGTYKQLNYIADPFIPIVILAHSLYENPDVTFYLSLYDLKRSNPYFLLI